MDDCKRVSVGFASGRAWCANGGPAKLDGVARLDPAKVEARCNEYKRGRSKILSEWIMEAREELAKGKPAFAYTLGRELHWFDSDKHRKVGEELLLAAYEALGRHALADIARAHYKHRDLPMVSAFEASERQRS